MTLMKKFFLYYIISYANEQPIHSEQDEAVVTGVFLLVLASGDFSHIGSGDFNQI